MSVESTDIPLMHWVLLRLVGVRDNERGILSR